MAIIVVGTIVNCSGANYPTIWVSLFMEGLLATECTFPLHTTRSREGEGGERSSATHRASKTFAIDGAGADGSAEGAPVAVCLIAFVCIMKPNSVSRLVNKVSYIGAWSSPANQ